MKISIETTIKSDLDTVWLAWNNPEDIKQWNAASDDWHTKENFHELYRWICPSSADCQS